MDYQKKFFDIIRALLPSNLSLAHEMSDLLEISVDSAYRRIRGETPLTLEETVKLCLRFDVPLEALNSEIPEVVTFHYQKMYNKVNALSDYLLELAQQIKFIANAESSKISYAAEDIPVFHHFSSDVLTKFKLFYWRKSILNDSTYQYMKYEDFELQDEELSLCKTIYQAYAQTASEEIWTEQTCMSTIQQIKFYWDAGFFSNPEDALAVCEAFKEMINEIQIQAETGMKKSGNSSNGILYSLYLSDLMIGNNGVVVSLNDSNMVFIGCNSFNFIRSSNKDFAAQNKLWMENLIRKSTLISRVSEKQRNQFFKHVQKQIEHLTDYLK